VKVTDGGILPDNPAAIRSALAAAAGTHDLLITSGGVSTGEEDHVRNAITHLGALTFWRLGIKPGRPVSVGDVAGTPLVGLPGNPVAAMVTYMAIARPLLAALGGEILRPPTRLFATADFSYRKKRDRREYVRVRLSETASGLLATRFPREGAGILTSLTESDALAELPEAMTDLLPGTAIACIPLVTLYD
jgi:molybdopterin molybdotransferase